jgi:hypothetical protein
MCCSFQSFPGVKLAKTWLTIGLVTCVVLVGQVAFADPAGPASAASVPANSESLGITIFWAGAALFACAAAAGGIILARKLHPQKALAAAGAVPTPAPAAQKLFSLPNGNGNGSKAHGSKPFRFNNRPAKTPKLINNQANGNAKRRRMFNYHKFYTEMVLQGPSPSTVTDNGYNPYAGYYVEYEPPRINNNGNGHNGSHNGNGNGNGHHDSNGHADLLATQKSLIQEQQRLIHEQARLIEEKSQLIAEKNQLLDRQSQMLDNNLL